ncbi:MAG: hypothetical protein LKK45_02650 [Bifidobacterium psychraerophilum]|jgi:hypothetical protein|uniref:hypothetical protein n=1 Tax=Bifidobacterium psychraerophilum TaxID=218140 RepID=UPI0023F7CB4A|nr:hypothetical protein [Bifidobacterium psychraerophilum]MCI1659689.1 hypothetical protein [Bifidobacterium psychraerophilum]MCI2176067.1 hypothetical protein [Bifidobacterium psychraerophilum]MCI2182685.1 hypothetical protein [Bifidobacterium psychraerophilum]
MPTFHDPTTDAAEASEALRGLAHASRVFDRPADMYRVLGDLSASLRHLHQTVEQVAANHETRVPYAFDDAGDHETGVRYALDAAEHLHRAARLLDQSYDRLSEGFSAAGRIAWHHDPAPDTDVALGRQWVTVVFLQGEEADQVLDIIQTRGVDAAVEHLARWDYGAETDSAAIINRDVHDAIPAGVLDRTAESGPYTLTYNPFMGHVALHRHPHTSEETPPEPQPEPEPPTRRRARAITPYEPTRRPASDTPRGLGL